MLKSQLAPMGERRTEPTRQPARHHNHYLHYPTPTNTKNTNVTTMMDSLTKKGRKFKQRFGGKKNKPDKAGADCTGESIDSSNSLLQPAPHIASGGRGGAGSRASADERQTRSGDRSPQPSVSVGGRDEDVDREEVNKGRSRPDPEPERVHSSLPSPPIPPPSGELEST